MNTKLLFARLLTENIAIVDVRTNDEYSQIAIPNTLHIPLDELEARISELKSFDKVYFFCKAGKRAMIAQEIGIAKGLVCEGLQQGVFEIAEAVVF